MSIPHIYFISRVAVDWTCPRKRWWSYHYDGKGLTPESTHLELYLGQALHDGLAGIARGIPIEDIAEVAAKQVFDGILTNTQGEPEAEYFAHEQAALIEGLLRGFNKAVWPQLQQRFPTIVAIEQEMAYEHDGLTFIARPDLIMEDSSGQAWYLEYKSTSSNKEQWINSWSTAVQLHSSVRAAEATLDRKVTGIIVQGLYKGFVSYGKQGSPFCYSYHRSGNPPFTKDDYLFEYKAGYKRTPVWDMSSGVKAWVDKMPAEVLSNQFPQTPPIFIREDLIEAFFRQRYQREHEIAEAARVLNETDTRTADREDIMDAVFPQRFDQCAPAWGHACAFQRLCHGHCSDPLKEGFAYHELHSPMEIKLLEDAADG